MPPALVRRHDFWKTDTDYMRRTVPGYFHPPLRGWRSYGTAESGALIPAEAEAKIAAYLEYLKTSGFAIQARRERAEDP